MGRIRSIPMIIPRYGTAAAVCVHTAVLNLVYRRVLQTAVCVYTHTAVFTLAVIRLLYCIYVLEKIMYVEPLAFFE